MSQENVDKTRGYIDAYNWRDFDAAMELFDPQVEWVLPDDQSSDFGVGLGHIRPRPGRWSRELCFRVNAILRPHARQLLATSPLVLRDTDRASRFPNNAIT